MGLLDFLASVASSAANTVAKDMERKSNNFATGYDHGAQRASRMSDAELRSSLKRAKENGVSDWNSAGKVRAMADEYKRRKEGE